MTLDEATKRAQIEQAWAAHQAARAAGQQEAPWRMGEGQPMPEKYNQADQAWAQHRAARGMSAGKVRAALRMRLSAEQNHRCCLCGKRTNEATKQADVATLEHLIPRSKGGRDTYDNCVMTCSRCNVERGDTPLAFE